MKRKLALTDSSYNSLRARAIVASCGLAVACFAAAAAAQTAPTHGTSKPAGYECSGMEGAALTRCLNLNAAATQNSDTRTEVPSNASHDCADMTGAALSTCMELNGQRAPATAPGNNGGAYYTPQGQTAPYPAGSNPNAAPSASDATTSATPLSGGSGNTGNSSGSNPTGLSGGSGATTPAAGSNPTGSTGGSDSTQPSSGTTTPGMSGGSGRTGSSNGGGR